MTNVSHRLVPLLVPLHLRVQLAGVVGVAAIALLVVGVGVGVGVTLVQGCWATSISHGSL